MKKSFAIFILLSSCVTKPPQPDPGAPDATIVIVESADDAAPPEPDVEPIVVQVVESPPMAKKGDPIMLVGDSLAVGLETEFTRLAKVEGYVPSHHVIGGTATWQWLRWIDGDMDRNKPKVVVVSLGTNDAAGYDAVQRDPKVFSRLVSAVEAKGGHVVWLGPPNISASRISKIQVTRELIKSSAPLFFESEALKLTLSDGIHTTGDGYRMWMDAAWSWMKDKNVIASEK